MLAEHVVTKLKIHTCTNGHFIRKFAQHNKGSVHKWATYPKLYQVKDVVMTTVACWLVVTHVKTQLVSTNTSRLRTDWIWAPHDSAASAYCVYLASSTVQRNFEYPFFFFFFNLFIIFLFWITVGQNYGCQICRQDQLYYFRVELRQDTQATILLFDNEMTLASQTRCGKNYCVQWTSTICLGTITITKKLRWILVGKLWCFPWQAMAWLATDMVARDTSCCLFFKNKIVLWWYHHFVCRVKILHLTMSLKTRLLILNLQVCCF